MADEFAPESPGLGMKADPPAPDRPKRERISGDKLCKWCGFPLHLENERVPKHCPACNIPYSVGNPTDVAYTLEIAGPEALTPDLILSEVDRAIRRRHCAAIEAQAGATADLLEAIVEIVDGFAKRSATNPNIR
jgi:hypothetical protein